MEQFMVPLIVGFVGSGVGGGIGMYVGQAIIKVRLDKMEQDFNRYIGEHSVTSKEWKAEINAAVNGHKVEVAETLRRVVFKDQCDQCGANGKERHSEVLRRIESLETSFRSCFDDLVKALRP